MHEFQGICIRSLEGTQPTPSVGGGKTAAFLVPIITAALKAGRKPAKELDGTGGCRWSYRKRGGIFFGSWEEQQGKTQQKLKQQLKCGKGFLFLCFFFGTFVVYEMI